MIKLLDDFDDDYELDVGVKHNVYYFEIIDVKKLDKKSSFQVENNG